MSSSIINLTPNQIVDNLNISLSNVGIYDYSCILVEKDNENRCRLMYTPFVDSVTAEFLLQDSTSVRRLKWWLLDILETREVNSLILSLDAEIEIVFAGY